MSKQVMSKQVEKKDEKLLVTKDFFKTNIKLPCTLRRFEGAEVTEYKTFFELRRQTQGEADELAKQFRIEEVTEDILRLKRLAMLLIAPPEGFGDFPDDKRPLAERAFEYFNDENLNEVVRVVMVQYDKAAYPAEVFRTF
jgi:hypothetical protein